MYLRLSVDNANSEPYNGILTKAEAVNLPNMTEDNVAGQQIEDLI